MGWVHCIRYEGAAGQGECGGQANDFGGKGDFVLHDAVLFCVDIGCIPSYLFKIMMNQISR